jgi:hypothetical protein
MTSHKRNKDTGEELGITDINKGIENVSHNIAIKSGKNA